MNILSAQEMNQAQISLLKTTLKPSYRLCLPAETQYQKLVNFHSTLFPPASAQAQQKAQTIVKLTDNMKGVKCNSPNGVFQCMFYSIMRILYQDKYRPNNENEQESGHYLLETIKCSLYSPDIDFTVIKGVDFPVETAQMKAMAATFLNVMDNPDLKTAIDRLKCLEWICEHNPLLVNTFVLFFRFILMRLQIEGSADYKTPGNIEESVVNLVQYFDLAYRNFGEMFMFYEEGIFMALTEEQIVVGDYFQNESQKKNELQQLQIKSSVKMNMIESFLMNVDEKSSLIAPKKKNYVVDDDMKLLNFILDDSTEEYTNKEKEQQLGTPHFNHESQDLFHFGRKRKQSEMKNDDIKMELRKLISDKSDSFIESEHSSDNEAPTPFLGGDQGYTLSARFAQNNVPEIISEQMAVQSPSQELDSAPQKGSNFVSHPDVRKTAQNLNLFGHQVTSQSHFSPKSQGSPTFQQAEGFPQATSFCQVNVPSIHDLQKCPCRPFRACRNSLTSITVSVSVFPNKTVNSSSKMFPTSTYEQGRKGTSEINSPPDFRWRPDHKPAFLKNLKRKGQSDSQRQFIQSTLGNNSNRTMEFQKRLPNSDQQKLLQKKSAILSGQKTLHHDKSSRSLHKDIGTEIHKSQSKVPYAQRFEGSGGMAKPGVVVQKTSGFYQKAPEYSQLNSNKSNHFISNQNSPSNSNSQPYKFYAPVQIIAPTVYVNSSKNNNNNNITLKVSDYKERRVNINDYGATPNPENRNRPQQRNDRQYETPLEMMKNNSGTNSCSAIKNARNL